MKFNIIIGLFKLIAPMVVHHESYLTELARDKELRKAYDFRVFVLPLIILCSIGVGLGYFLNGEHYRIEVLLIRSLFYFLSMIASYFVSIKLIKSLVSFLWEIELDSKNVALFVSTSFSILLVVDILAAFLPAVFFLQFAKFYVIIIMATLAPVLFNMKQKIMPMMVVLSAIILNLLPLILRKILYLMVPNI